MNKRTNEWTVILRSTITGCAVAQHCFNDDQQSNGKTGNLTRCTDIWNPWKFYYKNWTHSLRCGGNTHAKFYGNRLRGVSPTNSQNITSCDFVYLPFPFLPFPFFLVVAYSKNGWTYLIDQYVKRLVFSQGCAFWGWENLNLIFNWFI